MRKTKFKFLTIAILALFTIFLAGCPDANTNGNSSDSTSNVDPNEVAATVNGTSIKLVEVERAIKQQAQGQESKLSQLELAKARLQVLEQLIQQEVMYQKAETEGTIPTDEEVKSGLNKMKTSSGVSQEEFDKRMKEAGETEETLREKIKRQLAIQKLVDKIAGKVEPPKDSEIEAFYNGNKEGFKQKRGAQFAAIVIDPRKTSEDDTTTTEAEAQLKAKEIGQQLVQGADFATVAREKSEDPNTKLRGGDWRYFTEEQMKQTFGANFATFVMTKLKTGQIVPQVIPYEGRLLFLKLQSKKEKDEDRTLETPGVKEEITNALVNARKQLLSASYAAIAMDEAKIENYLARKVVENPNELSGARPASTGEDKEKKESNSNTESNSNADSKNDEKQADEKKADEKKPDEKKEDAKSDSNNDGKAKDEKKDDKK
ncbi:MAG: hypothetical protein HKN25_01890 [Pyrinomonadaceae bacterium]|nr:hypothetical protein [Pyrinomonadaceae bacterium]